jgi:hypothetical protein
MENERNGIDAVARVFRGESLPEEYMTEMGAAPSTLDLGAHPVRVRDSSDRAGDFLIEARPSTLGVELIFGSVQRRIAALTRIDAGGPVMFELAGEGGFGALTNDDPLLLPG